MLKQEVLTGTANKSGSSSNNNASELCPQKTRYKWKVQHSGCKEQVGKLMKS